MMYCIKAMLVEIQKKKRRRRRKGKGKEISRRKDWYVMLITDMTSEGERKTRPMGEVNIITYDFTGQLKIR